MSLRLLQNPVRNVALLFLGIAISLYSLHLLIVIISLVFTYHLLSRKLSTQYIDSRFILAVISLFTYIGILSLAIVISSAILEMRLIYVLAITGLMIAAILTYDILRIKAKPSHRAIIANGDATALIVSVMAVLFIGLLPLINSSVVKQPSNVLLTITGNVDQGVHLAIFNDYLDLDSNRIWADYHTSRSEVGGFYPTSWHGANASVVKALAPNIQTGVSSVIAYSFLNIFWVGILVFLSTKLSLTLVRSLRKQRALNCTVHISAALLSLLAVYMFDIHLLRFGFFSFVPQLITMLLIIYCLLQLFKDGLNSKGIIGITLLYVALSLATWILLLPVAACILILAIAWAAKKPIAHTIRKEMIGSWPAGLIAITSILCQFWLLVSVESAGKVSLVEGLLLDGGVPIYDPLVYAILLGGLLGWIALARKQEVYKPAIVIVASTIIFCAVLFIIQSYLSGDIHYYYYKSLLILPVVLVPFVIAAVGVFIDRALTYDRILACIMTIALPCTILLFVPSDKGMLAYIKGSRSVSAQANQHIINETRSTGYPSDKVTIYLIGTNESSDIASLLLQANRPLNDCFNELRLTEIIQKITQTAVADLARDYLPDSCVNHSVTFVVGEEYINLLDTHKPSNFKVEMLPS